MFRQVSLALVALAAWGSVCFPADEAVTVTVTEKREATPGGLQAVDRTLAIGNAEVHYHQAVNPNEGDRPVTRAYGDYLFGLEFPAGASWNWDLEYFLDVSVLPPGGEAFVANRATLQSGMHVRTRAYPFITTGPPERRRWLTTLTKDYGLTDAPQAFDPASEWALVLHNRHAQEERGCLLVFDPSEVRAARRF